MKPAGFLGSLHQLRCVHAAVRHGSFAAAADELGLSQPAVADHVRKLERSLGTPLFARHARGVRLTEAGAAFHVHVVTALGALDDAVGAVDELDGLRSGLLTFGLPATPEAYATDVFAAEFSRRHPGIRLRLLGRNSTDVADRVRDGELEAALVSLPVDDHGLAVRPVGDDEVVYVSADPAVAVGPATIELIAGRPLIVYDAGSGDDDPIRRQLARRTQEHGVRLDAKVETETMRLALRLAAAGVGDTYTTRSHTRRADFPAGLHVTTFDPPMTDTLAIVRRADARLSSAVTAFAGAFREHLIEQLAPQPVERQQSSSPA